jgi:hypothetical protein
MPRRCTAPTPSSAPCSTTSAASGVVLPWWDRISRSETPGTRSVTIAAPPGDSMYSYSRATFGSSKEASTAASSRNIAVNPGSVNRSRWRYLIATSKPEASCLATTTSPDRPEPSVFSSVYPGTLQSGMPVVLPSPGVQSSHRPGYTFLMPRQRRQTLIGIGPICLSTQSAGRDGAPATRPAATPCRCHFPRRSPARSPSAGRPRPTGAASAATRRGTAIGR